jgi:hypothetical protein
VSTDPTNPSSWQRLEGDGVQRTIASPTPGTHWVRAAMSRAKQQSAFFGPVPVVVK